MSELKIDPRKDALVGPAMKRITTAIYGILKAYEAKAPHLKQHDDVVLRNRLEDTLSGALFLAAERGYNLAITEGRLKSTSIDLQNLKQAAKRRATIAAKLIVKTTAKVLREIEAAIGKKNVASKDRAAGIVNFEMPKMLFMGARKGWGRIIGKRTPTKGWFTINENSCELCLENEDAGPIPIDDPFPSGDYEPGIHIGCECVLVLYT